MISHEHKKEVILWIPQTLLGMNMMVEAEQVQRRKSESSKLGDGVCVSGGGVCNEFVYV